MMPELKYDEKGLIPAIVQDAETGERAWSATKAHRLAFMIDAIRLK